MARALPERMTLVDRDTLNTLRVEDEMGELILVITESAKLKVPVRLSVDQAKKLRGRINKFIQENT